MGKDAPDWCSSSCSCRIISYVFTSLLLLQHSANACTGHSSASKHGLAIGNMLLKRNVLDKWRQGDWWRGITSWSPLWILIMLFEHSLHHHQLNPPLLNEDRTQRVSPTQSRVNNPRLPLFPLPSWRHFPTFQHNHIPHCHSRVAMGAATSHGPVGVWASKEPAGLKCLV